LRGLPERLVRGNEGRNKDGRSNETNDTWSPFDIVGHLIVGERTDLDAARALLLNHGEARGFDPSTASRRRKRVKASRWTNCSTSSPACAKRI